MPSAKLRTWLGPIAALGLLAAVYSAYSPPRTTPVAVFDGCLSASPLLVRSARGERIVVATSRGVVVAIDPRGRKRDWEVRLPAEWAEEAWLLATPVVVDTWLVVAYQTLSLRNFQRTSHRVAVIDLDKGSLDPAFPIFDLHAERPASDGSGMVRFHPPTQLSRAALAHGRLDPSSLGYVYVSFGSFQGIQPWHGWVFEIDLDAWKARGPERAISALLLTTPETHCGVEGEAVEPSMACGGGVWAPSGPQVVPTGDGYELIVPTGNGQLDLGREDYASALLRVGPGLRFERGCDERLCAEYDPIQPSIACLESCRNLFVPRLPPGEPPLSPASGRCEGKTFWQCLALMEYDLGGSSPVRVELRDGAAVFVQPGKDGAVYLLDAAHMGTMYDREQIVPLCGDAQFKCRLEWAGMIVAQPTLVEVDGDPVVLIPTFVVDRIHPAGLVALKIVVENGTPRLERLWQAPAPSSAEAVRDFRLAPSGVAVSADSSGRRVAWVAEGFNLWGFDVAGGRLVERVPLEVRSVRYARPLVHGDFLYVPVCVKDAGPSRLDAFRLP